MSTKSIAELKIALANADEQLIQELELEFAGDVRKGVCAAFAQAHARIEKQRTEQIRVATLYDNQILYAGGNKEAVILGLDEVGRGPLAGPLAIGGAVLPYNPQILGLNDSKQVQSSKRTLLAQEIYETAIATTVVYIEPSTIDEKGMSWCLKSAFAQAIANIEASGIIPDVVLLDGNPLHIDKRERNVIKGDATCAAISAASIIAKVARDSLMDEYDLTYPAYHFAGNKGYGSAEHIAAIKQFGLSPIHRRSFCTNFVDQTPTLFDSCLIDS